MPHPPLTPGLKFAAIVLGPDATKSAKYGLLKSGKVPVITVGKLIYVPTERGLRALGLVNDEFQQAAE